MSTLLTITDHKHGEVYEIPDNITKDDLRELLEGLIAQLYNKEGLNV